jgi:hypothetical protein
MPLYGSVSHVDSLSVSVWYEPLGSVAQGLCEALIVDTQD